MSSSYLTKHVQQVLGSILALGCSAKSLTLLFFERDAAKFGALTLFLFTPCFFSFFSAAFCAFTSAFFCLFSSFFCFSFHIRLCFFFSSLSFCSFSFCCFFSFSSSIASDSALVNSLACGKDLCQIPEGVAFAGHTKYFDMVVLPLEPAGIPFVQYLIFKKQKITHKHLF